MKTFKKTLPLILLSVLLALSMLIAGCTKEPQANTNEEEKQSETAQKDDTAQAEEEGLDHVKLTMITAGVPQSDHALVNDAINKYIKEDLNVTLDFPQIDFASWQDKSNLIIASGEECDILFTGDWTQYPTDAAKGAFIELDDLIPQYAPDIYAANYNWLLDAARINGKIYAVPTYQILAQSRGFILRKDLVDKYGPEVNFEVKDVNAPEDLEPLLKVIKEKEPDMTPLYQVPWKHLAFLGPYDRQGKEPTAINCYDDEPVYVNYYSTDYYVERAELARSWFEAGLTNADIATSKEEVKTIYAAGNIFAVGFQTNPSEKASIENMTGFEIVMYPTISPIISTSLARGAMFAIPIQSENPERGANAFEQVAY